MKISLRSLSKSYDTKVLDDLNIDLDGYSSIAIIGKSGCGKSTLLRLLTGIEHADQGSISVNDKDIDRDYQNTIGMVFQQHNLFPHLTLLENITLILTKIKRIKEEKARLVAEAILTRFQLGEQINKIPNNVSGGQAQRASIARALSTNPEIVFMDEPTAALDPILTKEVLDAILALKSTGTQFVFVTHELEFVKSFADYVIFMDEGKILEHGQVSIMKEPKTEMLSYFINKGEVA